MSTTENYNEILEYHQEEIDLTIVLVLCFIFIVLFDFLKRYNGQYFEV